MLAKLFNSLATGSEQPQIPGLAYSTPRISPDGGKLQKPPFREAFDLFFARCGRDETPEV